MPSRGPPIPTDLERELREQGRWRLKVPWTRVDWFDTLLRNEFLTPDEHAAQQRQALATMIEFAATHVPFYREAFRRANIGPEAIREVTDLAALPVLTRRDLVTRRDDLMPPALPAGLRRATYTRTSGTTGEPAQVEHTVGSVQMFGLLRQREYRWFRFDPRGTLAQIRRSAELSETLGPGQTHRDEAWPYFGIYFMTGPSLGFGAENPTPKQVEWLERHRPDYLMALAAPLEHLALACQERARPRGLRGLQAFGQQLTAGMRHRIEAVFGLPVQQSYGLNEIGLVAGRCPEGDRYHVHTEHCLVEIADEEGRPRRPGETGRILVTALRNPAMPLLRYDTGDSAYTVEDPCPCGRTLPSFAGILGRQRQVALLPPGTAIRLNTLRAMIEKLPDEWFRSLRQYQIHLRRDGSFVLRVVAAAPLTPEFRDHVHAAWSGLEDQRAVPLEVVQVDEIPHDPGRKFPMFTSDYAAEGDRPSEPVWL